MTTGYNFLKRLEKSIYKNIEIYNYNYFDAYKKENEVYNASLKFSKKAYLYGRKSYETSFESAFYNFQLLIELLERFQKEINISDRSITYLFSANEDIKLCYRFLYLGYYNTSGMHLRGFFEKMIHFILFYFDDLGKINEKIPTTLKDKINVCLKIGELSHKNEDNKGKDVYNKYYFPVGEIMKLYQFYSIDYVHNGKPDSNLCFDEKEFKKIYFLIKITLIYLPRFLKVTIGEQIETYWKYEILNPVDDYQYYWNYIQFLFGENKLLTNQYSGIYNLIHDDKDNKKYAFEELWLDINNLFEKEYLDHNKLLDKMWKKADGDRDKYSDLMVEYYETEKKKNNNKK